MMLFKRTTFENLLLSQHFFYLEKVTEKIGTSSCWKDSLKH